MWVRNGPASCRSSATHTSKLVLLPWHKLAASSSKQRSTKPMARAHSCLFCNHYQPFNNTTNTAGFARADLSDGKLAKQLARRHVANSHSTATCSLRSQVFQPTEITCAQIIATAWQGDTTLVSSSGMGRQRGQSVASWPSQTGKRYKKNSKGSTTGKTKCEDGQPLAPPQRKPKHCGGQQPPSCSLHLPTLAKPLAAVLLHWIANLQPHVWQPTSASADHKLQQKPIGNREISPPSPPQSRMLMAQQDVTVRAARKADIPIEAIQHYQLSCGWHQAQQGPCNSRLQQTSKFAKATRRSKIPHTACYGL